MWEEKNINLTKTEICLDAGRRDQDKSGVILLTQFDPGVDSTGSGGAQKFNGTIDDVRIYNRSLS